MKYTLHGTHYIGKNQSCRKTLQNSTIRCVLTRGFQIWCYFLDRIIFTPIFGHSKNAKNPKFWILEMNFGLMYFNSFLHDKNGNKIYFLLRNASKKQIFDFLRFLSGQKWG